MIFKCLMLKISCFHAICKSVLKAHGFESQTVLLKIMFSLIKISIFFFQMLLFEIAKLNEHGPLTIKIFTFELHICPFS